MGGGDNPRMSGYQETVRAVLQRQLDLVAQQIKDAQNNLAVK